MVRFNVRTLYVYVVGFWVSFLVFASKKKKRDCCFGAYFLRSKTTKTAMMIRIMITTTAKA